jgi:hypothetical protein
MLPVRLVVTRETVCPITVMFTAGPVALPVIFTLPSGVCGSAVRFPVPGGKVIRIAEPIGMAAGAKNLMV